MTNCPFCPMPPEGNPLGPHCYALEPINPVTLGHIMVIPHRHIPDFATDPATTAHAAHAAALFARQIGGEWNLITSKGRYATQTVHHLHLHLVPRRQDDGLTLPWTSQQTNEETP